MTKRLFPIITAAALALSATHASAQAPQAGAAATAQQPAAGADRDIKATSVLGDVTAINVEAQGLAVRTAAGNSVLVMLGGKTTFKRAQPGASNLEGATEIKLADVAVGDRVFAYGRVSADRKSVPAQLVVVMTKSDIAKKQEHDRLEWQRRGILGTVTAVNPAAKEITINTRTREGVRPVVVAAAGERVGYRRYAPDSVKFADAKPSSFAEVKVGDTVRALGERSTDGGRFTAEEVVSGSFKTIIGTVNAVDAASNQIRITPNGQNKPVTIVLNNSSNLRRLDPQAGQMLAFVAMRSMGGGPSAGGFGGMRPGGGQGGPPQGGGEGRRPEGAGEGQGGPRRGMMGGGGGFDLQEMVDRQPQATLAELKPGDVIIVSSTTGADPSRLTAITVLAGADQLLAAMQTQPRRPGQGGGGAPTSAGLPEGIDLGMGLPPL
jgi:hypothetical protein